MFFSPTGLQSNLSPMHLGVYPWANKPPAASVPNGARITAVFLSGFMSDWYVRDGYWAPVGGEAILVRKRLHDTPATAYNTLSEVPNAFNNFIIPDDLLTSPGAPSFETRAQGRRLGTLGATQAADLRIGVASNNNALGVTTLTNAGSWTSVFRVYGMSSQIDATGGFQSSGVTDFQDGGYMSGGTIPFASLSGQPIRLYAQNGASDGSETWVFHYCELTIHL